MQIVFQTRQGKYYSARARVRASLVASIHLQWKSTGHLCLVRIFHTSLCVQNSRHAGCVHDWEYPPSVSYPIYEPNSSVLLCCNCRWVVSCWLRCTEVPRIPTPAESHLYTCAYLQTFLPGCLRISSKSFGTKEKKEENVRGKIFSCGGNKTPEGVHLDELTTWAHPIEQLKEISSVI